MDYPNWAPPELVKVHMDHVEAIRLGPRDSRPGNEESLLLRDPDEPDICPTCGLLTCRCEHNGAHANSLWTEAMRYDFDATKMNEGILRRLLTHMQMEGFYAWISSAEVKATKNDWLAREQADGSVPFCLWFEFLRHKKLFDTRPDRTDGEKKKALDRIAKATEELHLAIFEDDDAAQIAKDALPAILRNRCIKFQLEYMEQPDPIARRAPSGIDELEAKEIQRGGYRIGDDGQISVDLSGRTFGLNTGEPFPRYEFDPNDPDDPGKCLPWDKQPLEQRLAWWRTEADTISVYEVLRVFAEAARIVGDTPDGIKQRRQDGGWRPFVIRTINQILGYWFERVPPSRVAEIASAILDETLARDDVRPYLR
jgi:hypothetical protein